MPNVTQFPRGLLALVGALTDGKNPDELQRSISSVIDLLPFYSLNLRERVFFANTAAGSAAGEWDFTSVQGEVPANQAWLVYNYTIRATIPIGLTCSLTPVLRMQASGATVGFAVGPKVEATNSTLANQLTVSSPFQVPFFAPPGAKFGGVTADLSAATAFNAQGWVDFVRLRV
jgi:hypothetical protein